MALNNLGLALVELRRFEEAIARYEQDIAICRETEDRQGEGMTLNNLGTALTLGVLSSAYGPYGRRGVDRRRCQRVDPVGHLGRAVPRLPCNQQGC
jgi:hypothetical protein